MGIKDIGKKIGNIAFKIAASSCSCGGECGKCTTWDRQLTAIPEAEKETRGKRNAGDNNQ